MCVRVYTRVCMPAYMNVYEYVHFCYVCMFVCMHNIGVFVCMHNIGVYVCMYTFVSMYVCTYTCMYACMCICSTYKKASYHHNLHPQAQHHPKAACCWSTTRVAAYCYCQRLDKCISDVLQHVAACCSVLQCVAVCCSACQRLDTYISDVLQYVAVCWSALQCVAGPARD